MKNSINLGLQKNKDLQNSFWFHLVTTNDRKKLTLNAKKISKKIKFHEIQNLVAFFRSYDFFVKKILYQEIVAKVPE
jgi:hypothetical protein